jgi:hypothetical protein
MARAILSEGDFASVQFALILRRVLAASRSILEQVGFRGFKKKQLICPSDGRQVAGVFWRPRF